MNLFEKTILIGLVVLAGLGLLYIWTSGARAGRRAERKIRHITQLGTSTLNALIAGGLIVAVQWATVTHTTSAAALGVVLGVPALLAGVSVVRLFTVTQVHYHHGGSRGGRRRGVRR